ncbi:hypothetical protein K461DRAFT_164075 [Myriangium duriaei CBS 260.36]|uniref:Uncharacterized protein n=1 Tax=Myriangium duriaei CBS 260.36 TaxID=1168546 RepID=A0A9P4J017_9PEZI|nr:hypothetical protein K461DRAFT_164075 [Myriangium duriaei CBS 260.36]
MKLICAGWCSPPPCMGIDVPGVSLVPGRANAGLLAGSGDWGATGVYSVLIRCSGRRMRRVHDHIAALSESRVEPSVIPGNFVFELEAACRRCYRCQWSPCRPVAHSLFSDLFSYCVVVVVVLVLSVVLYFLSLSRAVLLLFSPPSTDRGPGTEPPRLFEHGRKGILCSSRLRQIFLPGPPNSRRPPRHDFLERWNRPAPPRRHRRNHR